jgi:outer membrane lipoprotein-sorting protein
MNRIGFKAFACLFSALYCCQSFAAQPQISDEALSTEELREVQSKMSSRQDLSVDFVQLRTSALRPTKPSKSSGKALFAKPARFRWEIEKPLADILLYDGKSLFSYKPGEKTATRFDAQGDRASEIKEVINFVLDFDSLLKRYQIVKSLRHGKDIILTLNPKQDGALSVIDINVDSKSFYVRSLKMSFTNKNTSEFQFSNPAPGVSGPSSFSVPASMKVIEGV